MTDGEKLLDILMDNLPDDNPWEGAVKTLLDRLLANGVTFATDNNVGGKWIPVTERLPESQGDVLVAAFWHGLWQTMIGWRSDTVAKWRVITPRGEFEPVAVTHWMPLPPVPKEGE